MEGETGQRAYGGAEESALDAAKARATLYRAIIERYADYINEREQKTVPMLKSLVDPDDLQVRAIASGISARIRARREAESAGRVVETRELEYSPERDFLQAAAMAFEHAQSLRMAGSELSISFWLTYSEMERLGIADSFDRALLLCSILAALGSKDAKVAVLRLSDGSMHPAVTMFSQKHYVLDPSNRKSSLGDFSGDSIAQALSEYAAADGRRAESVEYSFNREEYEEKEE